MICVFGVVLFIVCFLILLSTGGIKFKMLEKVERRTAAWMKMSDAYGDYFACSECGEDQRFIYYNQKYGLFLRLENTKHKNYCPNCGAKMEET